MDVGYTVGEIKQHYTDRWITFTTLYPIRDIDKGYFLSALGLLDLDKIGQNV